MIDESEKPLSYGLDVSRVKTFNTTFFGPYYDNNQDRILVPEWPRGTRIVYVYPKYLRELYFDDKPKKVSQISGILSEQRYSGIFLTQVALSPSEDITDIAREAFAGKLYSPDKLEKKNFGIRCWAMSAKLKITLPPQNHSSRHGSPEQAQLDDNVTAYVLDSTISCSSL